MKAWTGGHVAAALIEILGAFGVLDRDFITGQGGAARGMPGTLGAHGAARLGHIGRAVMRRRSGLEALPMIENPPADGAVVPGPSDEDRIGPTLERF